MEFRPRFPSFLPTLFSGLSSELFMRRKSKSVKPNSAHWIDMTISIKKGMVRWPHDPSVQIKRKLDMNRGEKCNVSFISMGSHTGTHMDPPLHFIKTGKSLDQMPLEASIGTARV